MKGSVLNEHVRHASHRNAPLAVDAPGPFGSVFRLDCIRAPARTHISKGVQKRGC